MTYVGRGVDAISNVEKLTNITFDGSTTYNLVKDGVAFTPAGKNNILISINGVIQQGNFTVAGATIVFDFSPTSNDTCNFIMHYGTGVLNTPADDTVKTATVQDDAITTDKLANSINTAITANTAKTTNATHSGEVTGATALTIADNIVDEANLKVSNAPTNGYSLTAQSGNTGGLTWASVGGDNTPAFSAYKDSADQSLSGGGDVKVQYETEIFDSNGKYDTSNYRFTPTVAGKYFFMASAYVDTTGGVGTLTIAGLKIKKNGTTASKQRSNFDNNSIRTMTQQISCILDLDADDYVEVFAHAECTSGNGVVRRENIEGSNFIGFKLIT